jgi:hypothetical protein
MAANVLSILINVKQTGEAALTKIESGLRRITAAGNAYSSALSSMNSASSSLVGSIGQLAAVLGSADLYRRAIASAFQYNDTVQQSQIGIAALVRSFNDFRDANGEAVDAQKAYQLSMNVATEIQKKLQVAGLQTTATYEQLLRVMQEGLGPAFKAGFKPDEIVKFVSMMAQAGAALSLPMDQLGQEVRAILDGTIDRNARIAKALGITNEQMKKVIASGEGFKYVTERLKDFEKAGEAAAKTFSGAWSNLVDAVQMALGGGLKGAFDSTTKLLLDLQKAVVTIDEDAKTFTFNKVIVSALEKVNQAIVDVLANGKSIDDWVETAAEVFSGVAVAVLEAANAFIKVMDAVGPILPALVQAATYIGLVKLAFMALVGWPLAIAREIKGVASAIVVLTGGNFIAWLGGLRAALATAASGATGLALAFKVVLVGAAVQAVMEIGNLISAVYKWIQAEKDLEKAQEEAKEDKEIINDRVIRKLEALNKATGLNIKSMAEFNKLVKTGGLIVDKVSGGWVVPKPGAGAMLPKPTGPNEADVKDQERLEKQLADDLIKLSGDKWAVLRNQAKQHYAEQLEMAHGNAKLIAQAKEVLTKSLAKIGAEQSEESGRAAEKDAKKVIAEQEKIDIAVAKSQAARAKAATETALAMLETIYERGEVSIKEYFTKRSALLEDEYRKEMAALEAQLNAENEQAEKIRIQDEIFGKQEKHKQDILNVTQKQIEAEKKLAETQKEIERILSNISMRVLQGQGNSDQGMQFAAELRQMDQQHQEEIDSLKKLKAAEDQIEDAHRKQQLEKDQLLANQRKRIWESNLDAAKVVASSLSQAFSDLYEMSGKKNKEFFYLAKAAAIAEAIINTAQAVTKALAQGGMWGVAQAMALSALGGVQIAKIQAQTLAYGGPVGGWSPNKRADNVPIWATAGEYMQPVDTVMYYGRGIMEALRRRLIPRELFDKWNFSVPSPSGFALAGGGSVPAGSGASFMVSVPVTVTGARDADKLSRVLPAEIEQTVIRVMREQLR